MPLNSKKITKNHNQKGRSYNNITNPYFNKRYNEKKHT